MKKLTEEEFNSIIEKYYEEITRNERKFVIRTGCKTYGNVILGDQICNDEECKNCFDFKKLLEKEFKKVFDK